MTLDAARRAYRRLLPLAPARLRQRHAEEMEDAFADVYATARAAGRFAVALVWLRAIGDLVVAAVRYRRTATLPTSLPAVHSERRSLMLGTEVRSAFRSFCRQKFATTLVVVMLGLGIAATMVVFSLVNELFLRPFPFPEPDRLVYINEKALRWNLETTGVDFVDFYQWRKAATKLEAIGLYDDRSFNLSDEQSAERIAGAAVTYDFFPVLRVSPILGRTFTPEEDRPKGPDVMLISERLWQDKFARDPHVLGKTLRLQGRPFEIIGVMPKAAEFPDAAAVWIALRGDPNQEGNSYSYSGFARLKPGVTVNEAEQDLLAAHVVIWEKRDKEKVVSPFVQPLREPFVSDFRSIARALATAVGLLLTVACANVAAVMLARAIARRREIGIRLAIGASRIRLLRQLFVENLLLAILGGILGFVLGRWALHLLVTSVTDLLPPWASFHLDYRIVVFAAAIAVGTALLFGWAPALHAVRGDLRTTMSDSVAGSTVSPRGRRTLGWLIAAEFMMAAVLLVGGAQLLRAFNAVRHTDPGYRTDHAFLFSAALPGTTYPDGKARIAFWDRLLERLRAAPGVEAAGVISCPPLTCHWGNFYRIEGQAPLKPGESQPVTLTRVASEGYFEAMGIRLKFGRLFDANDGREGGERVVIVNEMFVRTFWPGTTDAVGKRISFNNPKEPWMTVIGVTRDIKHYGLERPMRPGLYFPAKQLASNLSAPSVVVRTTGDPAAFESTARTILREMDPTVPLYRGQTAERMLRNSMRTRATYSWMLAVFAGLALVLALGGTYGVTSYLVTQRTREIGIRLAMGAQSGDIVGGVLRGSLLMIGSGVVVGLVASMLVATQVGDLLFGVSPRDPSVLAATAVILALAAVVANWIPARRAARTDPMASLRE